ncbi:MAG: twin-arginine translocase subunit TatC [Schleiferiaceae bacterium]
MSDGQTMPFLAHLAALRTHLVRASAYVLGGAVLAFVAMDWIFNSVLLAPKEADFITYELFCRAGTYFDLPNLCIGGFELSLLNTQMAGQFSLHVWLSLVAGLILAFPLVLFELWRFIAPGLTERERKMSGVFVGSASLLFFSGALFGYYVIVPLSLQFLATYTVSGEIQNLFEMSSYLSTVTSVVVATGLLFELPVAVYLLSRLGLTTPEGMRTYRRHSWIGILALSAVITPPDIFSQIVVSLPVALLYELSIGLSRFAQWQRENRVKDEAA